MPWSVKVTMLTAAPAGKFRDVEACTNMPGWLCRVKAHTYDSNRSYPRYLSHCELLRTCLPARCHTMVCGIRYLVTNSSRVQTVGVTIHGGATEAVVEGGGEGNHTYRGVKVGCPGQNAVVCNMSFVTYSACVFSWKLMCACLCMPPRVQD